MYKKYYTEEQTNWLLHNCKNYTLNELCIEFEKQFGICKNKNTLKSYLNRILNCTYKKKIHRYTTKENQWLIKNYNKYTNEQLTKLFNEKFNCNVSNGSINSHCLKTLKTNPKLIIKNRHRYTLEEDQWLINNRYNMTDKQLAIEFNKKFNCNIVHDNLAHRCVRLNIKKEKQTQHNYTEEQKIWLSNNAANFTRKKLAELFNEKFNCNIQPNTLKYYAVYKLNIKKENYDYLHSEKYTIKTHSDGQVYIKLNNLPGVKNKHINWKLLNRYIWEQHYGPIPKNYYIIFLDGDTTNCTIENLRCVSFKTFNKLTHRGWYGKNGLTLAGIKCCELEQAIKKL